MTTVAERVSTEARQIHVGRALLAVFVSVFFAIGWVAAKVVLALAFIGAAIKIGWQDARGKNRGTAR